MKHTFARAVVVAGYGVASGRTGDPRFPGGTIGLQLPIFRKRGVDVARLLGARPFVGTINLDLSPLVPEVLRAEIVLNNVTWSPRAPPENFWLSRAVLDVAGQAYVALIYRPDPATKSAHFQPASVVEIIAPPVADIATGSEVMIGADPAFIRFVPAAPQR